MPARCILCDSPVLVRLSVATPSRAEGPALRRDRSIHAAYCYRRAAVAWSVHPFGLQIERRLKRWHRRRTSFSPKQIPGNVGQVSVSKIRQSLRICASASSGSHSRRSKLSTTLWISCFLSIAFCLTMSSSSTVLNSIRSLAVFASDKCSLELSARSLNWGSPSPL